MRFSRPLTLTVALGVTLLTALVPIGPSADAGTADTAGAASKTITLVLKPEQPRVLTWLAAHRVTHRRQRLAALDGALPSAAGRSQVIDVLERLGLTVTGETTWTVSATGEADKVADLFGTRPKLPQDPTAKQFRAATGSLPDQPGSLDGLVAGVYPATGGPQVFQPRAASALTGADVRNADTPAGATPSTGQHDAGLTIATLQFAKFDASDLTTYARDEGLKDPVAAKRYQAVMVDKGPSDYDGNEEVALDQESILSTAPSAVQRAYFAPNTDIGYVHALEAVLADVRTGSHISALSISWGLCETLTGSSFIAAAEPVLKSLVAAGVTVFAASGDNGIYDCGSVTGTGLDDDQADVDYPASSPYVVATGATHLTGDGSPNDGSNWTEEVWSCTDVISCEDTTTGTGGSGGGVSGSAYRKTVIGSNGAQTGDFPGFDKPSYQKTALTSGVYSSVGKRLVPDIAADGDPASGFEIVYTDHSSRRTRQVTAQAGGTSLAAPISAAQLVNTLGDAGVTGGVGDIHQALYTAYTATKDLPDSSADKVFRDVTSGTNGASEDKGDDPSVGAGNGYDTASGLGGVLWPALTPYLLGSGTPSAAVHLKTLRAASTRRRTAVRLRWSTGRGTDTLSTHSTTVVVRTGKRRLFHSTAPSGSRVLRVRPATRLIAVVTASDPAGRSMGRTARLKAPRLRRR